MTHHFCDTARINLSIIQDLFPVDSGRRVLEQMIQSVIVIEKSIGEKETRISVRDFLNISGRMLEVFLGIFSSMGYDGARTNKEKIARFADNWRYLKTGDRQLFEDTDGEMMRLLMTQLDSIVVNVDPMNSSIYSMHMVASVINVMWLIMCRFGDISKITFSKPEIIRPTFSVAARPFVPSGNHIASPTGHILTPPPSLSNYVAPPPYSHMFPPLPPEGPSPSDFNWLKAVKDMA
jgi:hypothetical protein